MTEKVAKRGLAQKLLVLGGLSTLAPKSQAHSFGEIHTLPIPFELYAWGAVSALVASFLFAAAAMLPRRALPSGVDSTDVTPRQIPLSLLRVLQAIMLTGLLACLATGWFGTPQPYANFNMTAFWVCFVLGMTYLSVLVGNLYALINPWRVISRAVTRCWPDFDRGRLRYPAGLGHLPALLLYVALVWVELIGGSGPRSLSWLLAGYTVIQLLGVWLFGAAAWWRHGELFSVFMRLAGRLAPIRFAHDTRGDIAASRAFAWQLPLAGLRSDAADARSDLFLLLFVLFMLSSTAFDSLHETAIWHALYWLWLHPQVLAHWVGADPFQAFATLRQLLGVWNSAWLVIAPLLYLLVYLAIMAVMRAVTRSEHTTRVLAGRFLPSLLPIAIAYHAAHYLTLLYLQGPRMLGLISDPFGRGQDWFGTADWFRRMNLPEMTDIWHMQVGVIVGGHVLGVLVAHREALACFGTRRAALLSQVPMLILMLGLTVGGLWILSQPFQR